ncbi:unnamed protein product [Dicrocoelium dendriticum]|nr:unnamed protein product [Dicrocoelium dendriticum]
MSRWQRLSGYLLTKPTGPFKRLKGSQRQWYEFDEASMTIRVFRTEEEANTVNKEPLRVINVLNAVFNIDPSELNQFVITSDDKEHVLQAETEEAMHLWLHTLKSRRNEAINSDPTTLLSYDTTLSMERKKPVRNSVTKIPPNLMKPASEITYDLSEFQCNPPLNTAVDWRARRTFSSTSSSNTSQGHSYTPTTPPKTHVDAQETFVTMRQTSIPEEQLSECRPSSNQTADPTMDLVSDNIDALRYRQVVDEDEEDGAQPQTLIVSTTFPVPDTLKHFWNISSNGRTQLDRQHLKSTSSINNHVTSITGGNSPVNQESRQQPDEPNHLPNAKDDVSKSPRKEEGYVEDSTVVELPLVDHKSSDLFDFGGFTTVQSMDSLFGRLSGSNVTPNTVRVLRNELEDYHERVSWLQKTLSLREAALAELDQRIRMQDDADDKPYSLSIPPGASNTTLRNMLHEMEQKQRILHSRMRFLVGEIRDLSAVRQMLTDHGAKQVRYTRKLTTEVFEWKQEYVKLLECCLGAFHLDATHGLMFSDYGKKRCKAKLAALLEESRRKDPSLPSLNNGIWRMLVRGELKATILEKGPHYYNRLIAEISESKVATKYRKQISLDLLRTMPNNVHFDSLESPGIQKLQEVLQAYSIHNPEIGYCQGMNFLVAVALLVLHKEDAFWCLTAILEKYLPSKYFNCGLISAQVDQLVLKDLLASKLPKLAEHINRMEIDISAITLNWFLVLFYDCVPFETLIRIWDVFLLEGPKSLFRFALALLKRSEEILLLQADTISFWKCLKSVARLTYDADSLMKTAYEEFQPFVSRSTIASLRNQHYEILSKEMNEKKSVWQSVHKEVAEELLDEPEEIARRRISKVDRPCIHAATSYNERFVWICHGDKFSSHITEVQVAENRMIQLDMHLDTRVTCAAALHENTLLVGTMSGKLCAYSIEFK